jgi:thiamine kinase-like enzyme
MIISPFSVYHFLLGLPYEMRNEILRNLRDNLDSVDISAIYIDNPKNTFLRVSSTNFNYIIKQPKLYKPEQSWMIDVEAEFYKKFKHKKYLINNFYYHNANKTLFLPLLETLKFRGENLGYLINQWHSDMLLKKQSNKKFSKNSILNNGTPYQRLVDILKITRNNRQSLNDTFYKVNLEGKALDQQEKIIDFLYEKNTKEFFIDWIDETKKIKTHIIHGDLRIENIILLQEQHKIIDFELVCEGDPMWDIAQIIESIFSQNIFKKNKLEIFEDKFNYLISVLSI